MGVKSGVKKEDCRKRKIEEEMKSNRFIVRCLIILVLMMVSACHRDGLSSDQRAARKAAEKCYRLLQNEKYDAFVNKISYAGQMSPEYKSQMADLAQEHSAALQKQHGGLVKAEAIGDSLNGQQAYVYLQLTFADETTEVVGLSMVKVEDEWLMQ